MALSVVYATVNGELVEETREGVITTYVSDTLGSVIQTRNAAGTQTSSTTYWPFGEIRTSTGTNPSPWGFCGAWGYFKDALNRLYVRARILRPDLSRWLTVDPLWPRIPAYIYAFNRAVQIADPTGLRPVMPPPRGGWGGWSYGNYCGAGVKQNPALHILPQDCVDSCCMMHDRCLEAQYGAGLGGWPAHACCDQMLLDCVVKSRVTDCCSTSPTPIACYWAMLTIDIAFSLLALNPVNCDCVPANEWGKYSRINWGGPGLCREISVPSGYGCKSGPKPTVIVGEMGGEVVGRSGGAPIYN